MCEYVPQSCGAAGHGSQVADATGDQPDGMNETLCPTDFRQVSCLTAMVRVHKWRFMAEQHCLLQAGMIIDAELNQLLINRIPQGVRARVCHSPATASDKPVSLLRRHMRCAACRCASTWSWTAATLAPWQTWSIYHMSREGNRIGRRNIGGGLPSTRAPRGAGASIIALAGTILAPGTVSIQDQGCAYADFVGLQGLSVQCCHRRSDGS